MSKKWYNYFVSVDPGAEETAPEESVESGKPAPKTGSAAEAIAEIAASVQPPAPQQFTRNISAVSTFDEIYQAAEIRSPAHGYTVYKVADMLQNPHIRELPREIKKSSVLVALEASGVQIREIVEDAVRRDKALDTFESVQRKAVEELEARKAEENRQAQAEVDRILAEFRSKIQANNEAVAKEKERFQSWVKQKQAEEQKIADTIGYFVTENPVTVSVAPAAPTPDAKGVK